LGEVSWIEIDDHIPLSEKIFESNITAIAGWQSEIGCGITNSEQLRHLRRSFCGSKEKRLSSARALGKG